LCPDVVRGQPCDTKRPWRSVTSGEGVGENLIDVAFFRADVLWLVVVRIRPASFVSIRETFHVGCLSRQNENGDARPVGVIRHCDGTAATIPVPS